MNALSVEFVAGLYRQHAASLREVREAQRALYAQRSDARLERFGVYRGLSGALRALRLPAHYKRRFRPKLDDIEAEVTYLLLRAVRPEAVVEIAPYYGWSTTWILHALRDNGTGHLYSYDLVDYATRTVPPSLSEGRWTFVHGDVRQNLHLLPRSVGYLFIDAAHTAEFARWYVESVFPRLTAGSPISIHDVFHRSDASRFTEGPVVVAWLEQGRVPYFTAAPAKAPDVHRRLMALKEELRLAAPIHDSRANPAVFFRLP